MTFSSHLHMPGAFHTDSASTVHPGLFRPPMPSPSSSSSYLPTRSTTTTALDVDTAPAKRKRLRDANPVDTDADLDGDGFPSTPGTFGGVYDRTYALAGQLGTPFGGPSENGILGESMYSDSDYRRLLGAKPTHDDMDAGPTPLFNLPPQPIPAGPGWGSLAFNTLGGVVGRVWQFCKVGAFKGFHAGGGTSFEIKPDGSTGDVSMFDSRMNDYQNIPGRFPQVDHHYEDDVAEERIDSRASTPSRQAPKRRQTEQTDDLGRNWVIVNESQERKLPRRPVNHRSSPRNRNQGPSVTTGRRISTPTARLSSANTNSTPRRPSSRTAFHDSPSLNPPRPASSASFASSRPSSPTKIPKVTSTPTKSSSQPTHSRRRSVATTASPGPPAFSHRRTHSGASTASHRGADMDGSPRLDAEAKQLAARRKMDERNADVRIAAFNKRLQDMIRQGKEALGTTVEVQGSGDGTWEDAE